MKDEQKVIDEEELVVELEPSETFSRLIGRVGTQVGVGNLSLPVFSALVRQHADSEEEESEEGLFDRPLS